MTHSTVGTRYMSPECIQAGGDGGYDFERRGHRCLLYELAAAFVLSREDQLLLARWITSGTFDPLPGGLAQLRELVDSLLRVDVAARGRADAYERAVAAAG